MKNYLVDLNEEQKKAVTHVGSPLLVQAGAGSGKTRVLIHRTIFLITELGVSPEKIILLTFTNKAAAEMKKRIGSVELSFAGTFHTFCARLLRRHGVMIGIDHNFLIYDSGDQESLLKMVIKNLNLDPKSNRPGLFQHLISRMKNDLISPDAFEGTVRDDFGEKLLKVFRGYNKGLKDANALDFDDLLTKTVELLKKPDFYERFKDQYDYVLIDEYQDTNKAQFELTRLLAFNKNGLTVVGDAAQAIYSFRGADYRNLLMLESEFPEIETITLPKNYRSTQKILDAAYGVVLNNKNHPVLRLDAQMETGDNLELSETMDEKEEAAFVVGVIREATKESEDLAVLYRTNAQSRAIEEALIRRKIPYRLVGGVRFYDRAEIKDLLAGARVVTNPKDLVSWERIEKNFGKRMKAKVESWADKESSRLRNLPPLGVLEEFAKETAYFEKFNEKDEEDVGRLENIRELLAVAQEFESLNEFLESVALIQSDELAERNDNGSKVTLMTIHSAKGLEFDRVIIVGLEEGLLPHSRSLLDREDVEEERRLMYVAMTRAKKKLYLSLTHNRLTYGGRHSSIPSRFLSEIPEETITQVRSTLSFRDLNPVIKTDDFNEGRIIISDETIAKETANDFADIDAW